MPIGFNLLLWTTHVTDELWPVIEDLAKTGYDGVEVPLFEGTPEDYAAMKRRLDDLGLRSTTVAVLPEGANPIADDAALRDMGQKRLDWFVDCSQALGAEVVCGPFYQPLGEFTGQGPTGAEKERAVKAHQAMADHAARHAPDLTIAVEPLNRFECYFMNTAEQAAEHCARVDRANFGYLYDTFHFNIEERNPADAISATAERIVHVHISENDRGTPGRGHIAFDPVFERLRHIGYEGWLTVESFGQALPDLAAAARIWRPLFDSEEQVYREAFRLINAGWRKPA